MKRSQAIPSVRSFTSAAQLFTLLLQALLGLTSGFLGFVGFYSV